MIKWFDKNNYVNKNRPMYIKIGKQKYKNSDRVIYKLSTSISLKEYLDKNNLSCFKFGVVYDKKENKKRLFILFIVSNQIETLYNLRKSNGEHKTNIGINALFKKLKTDGIELPLIRMKIEPVESKFKKAIGLSEKSHLFEVIL